MLFLRQRNDEEGKTQKIPLLIIGALVRCFFLKKYSLSSGLLFFFEVITVIVEQAKGKMAIQFDNGDKWLVELRGSGWIKDCTEGKSWMMKKFGGLTSLDVKKERESRERFVKTVAQNSPQKWVGFSMSGMADVRS